MANTSGRTRSTRLSLTPTWGIELPSLDVRCAGSSALHEQRRTREVSRMSDSPPAEEPFDLDSIPLADLGDLAAEWDAVVNGRAAGDVEVFDAKPARWRCTVSVDHPAWTM